MSLDWFGKRVAGKVHKASRIGVNMTMGEGVTHAKANHPFQNQTGTAERSIRIAAAAVTKMGGRFTVGLWGSVQVIYFRWLEFGTPGGRKAYPTLRPAAAKTYPKLAGNIKRAFSRA